MAVTSVTKFDRYELQKNTKSRTFYTTFLSVCNVQDWNLIYLILIDVDFVCEQFLLLGIYKRLIFLWTVI